MGGGFEIIEVAHGTKVSSAIMSASDGVALSAPVLWRRATWKTHLQVNRSE